jgi:tetratricopeptide (TPR) repeat protein
MSNVDLIIHYLSGQLNDDEARYLEQRLTADPEFRKEFDLVSEVYNLMGEQLRKRDENAFRSKLMEVMERKDPGPARYNRFRRGWVYALLPLAAALALILVLMLPGRNEERIFSRFYHPEEDPVLLAGSQVTRGETAYGFMLYHEGKYQQCIDEMSRLLEGNPENRLALLYHLLASLEVGMEEAGLEKIDEAGLQSMDQLDRSLLWYVSLALIKSGRMEQASGNLAKLVNSPGPYQSEAIQLQKVLLK